MSDVIESLRFALAHGFGASLDVAHTRDVLARYDEAEQRGYERGLREGREAERARINRGNSAMSLRIIADRASGIYAEELRRLASVIEHAEHAPTPQGDEPGALVIRHECESNDSNKAPERDEETALRQWREREAFGHVSHADETQIDEETAKPCVTCGGRGVVKRKSCACWPCPDCAGESGGSDG